MNDCNHPVEDFCVQGDKFVCAKCGSVLDIQAPANAIEDMMAGELA